MKRLFSKKGAGTRKTKRRDIPQPVTFITFDSFDLKNEFIEATKDADSIELIRLIKSLILQTAVNEQFFAIKKISCMLCTCFY